MLCAFYLVQVWCSHSALVLCTSSGDGSRQRTEHQHCQGSKYELHRNGELFHQGLLALIELSAALDLLIVQVAPHQAKLYTSQLTVSVRGVGVRGCCIKVS